MNSPFELLAFDTSESMARAAASAWLEAIAGANREGRTFGVALSGGRFVKTLFNQMVEQARAREISLAQVHFFWADERCLPPTDAESNFRLAQETLFTHLPIPPENIHRLQGEVESTIAVQQANAELTRVLPANAAGMPVLDLVLLGMGEDGHVASLFPQAGAAVTDCREPFLAVDDSPKPPPRRLSLSYPAITSARAVWVLVSGSGKADALRKVLKKDSQTPCGRVIREKTGSGVKIYFDFPFFHLEIGG